MDNYRVVGTAGHIDHGKSALVKTLTGTDPDRLQEEQDRGITIDLGFAHATLPGGLRLAFIDVPGHERFVKNMLAGVGGIDAVLMVVAADESIMPQTREHLAICQLLGVERGVVAITKADLVDSEMIELVELEISELLEDTSHSSLSDVEIVHTSVTTGAGIDELRAALERCLSASPARASNGLLRLPVDRVFTMKGFGTVVTGTLLGGRVEVGERVEILPDGLSATVRGIQVHGVAESAAEAGQRLALNLHGVGREQIDRGTVIGHPSSLRASHLIDARVRLLPDAGALKHLQRLRFHHGAAEVLCRVALLSDSEESGEADDATAGAHNLSERAKLPAGGSGLVQLRLESPYPVAPGDRFILRRYSPVTTIGGGVVIDPVPAKHRGADLAVATTLRRLENGSDIDRMATWIGEAGPSGLTLNDLATRHAQPAAAVTELLERAAADGVAELIESSPPRAVAPEALEGLMTTINDTVAAYHATHPLRPTMPKEELRSAVAPQLAVAIFEAAIARLEQHERVRVELDGVAAVRHRVVLDDDLEELRAGLLASFAKARLKPPSLEEALAGGDGVEAGSGDRGREVLQLLIHQGELVRLKDGMTFHQEALERLVDGLRQQYPRGEQFSVADFKDWAGVTRKHAIPLLEYLDGRRITRRVGNVRERL